jgi:Bacterial Ig-like domain
LAQSADFTVTGVGPLTATLELAPAVKSGETVVKATFSEPVDPSTVTASTAAQDGTFTLVADQNAQDVGGHVTVSGATAQLTAATLRGQQYTATLSDSIQSLDGLRTLGKPVSKTFKAG